MAVSDPRSFTTWPSRDWVFLDSVCRKRRNTSFHRVRFDCWQQPAAVTPSSIHANSNNRVDRGGWQGLKDPQSSLSPAHLHILVGTHTPSASAHLHSNTPGFTRLRTRHTKARNQFKHPHSLTQLVAHSSPTPTPTHTTSISLSTSWHDLLPLARPAHAHSVELVVVLVLVLVLESSRVESS